MTKLNTYKPNFAIHPGETVAELMKVNNWNNRELATRIELDQNTVGKIISGKDDISNFVATKLGIVFGLRPSFFVNLQALYTESKIRKGIKIAKLDYQINVSSSQLIK